MKKVAIFSLAACLLLASCQSGEEEKTESFLPVLSILQSQVAQVDTTLNSIFGYITRDSSQTDTLYIHRDQFRALAGDFLSIPDLSSQAYKKRYTEEKQFDETLNRALFVYTPLHPDKELIQREEVLIKPEASGDKITTIIINSVNNTKDSAVQKRMLWQVDKSFQVVTIRRLAGQPETTTTLRVVWSED